jgi:hypothetical protein
MIKFAVCKLIIIYNPHPHQQQMSQAPAAEKPRKKKKLCPADC